ncbi:MAG: CCA tRNA nucleotidyltransferase [Pseudomonadota bacterium]
MVERIDQPWLAQPSVQKVLALLSSDGGEARVNGGAVRNALLNEPVGDIDIATTLEPSEVVKRAKAAKIKSVPTGIDHGTVTLVIDADAFEVTTLRSDVETDGRHAVVRFGTDWTQDAQRRDLTMNALYCAADGTVFDPLSGYDDLMNRRVRFIGDALDRIREDRLRILRFFRFFAWYGAFRPDADGLRACVREKNGLRNLSAERIWQELSKLLAAPDPSRALLWMRQTGVLSVVLEESENWGIDTIHGLVRVEKEQNWQPDAVLRLMAIIPPNTERVSAMSRRLKLPNRVRDRLLAWAVSPMPDKKLKKPDFHKWLYGQDKSAVEAQLRLLIASDGDRAKKAAKHLKWLMKWAKPTFPVRGSDLLQLGFQPGPDVSKVLNDLETRWVNSQFELTTKDLLDDVTAPV